MESIIGLAGLAAFSFVSAVTPGPNNVLLWASGMRFGLRRTVPHIVGTAIGIGLLAMAVALGLGALITAVPALATVMRLAGSIYLVWLAWRILRAGDVGQADVDQPMSLPGAIAFQAVNPKAWVFALGAVATFQSAGELGLGAALIVAAVMIAAVIPATIIWAGAGDVIGGLIENDRERRIVSIVLAVLVLLTVVVVWL